MDDTLKNSFEIPSSEFESTGINCSVGFQALH